MLLRNLPTYPEWVLVYVTKVSKDGNWVDGFIVGMCKSLRDKGYENAGPELSHDWDIDAERAPKIGLAYFLVSMGEDDILFLDQPEYAWLPPG